MKQSCTRVIKNILRVSLASGDICLEARRSVLCVQQLQAQCRLSCVPLPFFFFFFFLIGDNITMLTTADWLLGSNSQSAAGLSTLSGRMKREYLLFFCFVLGFFYTFRMKAQSTDDLPHETFVPNVL